MKPTLRKIEVQRQKAEENILYFKIEMFAKLLILILRLLVLIMASIVINVKITYLIALGGTIYFGYKMNCVYNEYTSLLSDIKNTFTIDENFIIKINLKKALTSFKIKKKEENYGK